jgi:dolichol kinase
MKLEKQEILRKLLHIAALLMPIGIFYVPEIFNLSKWVPVYVLGTLLFASVLTEVARFKSSFVQKIFLKFFKNMMRKKEEFRITGSTYILGSGFLCSLFFVNRPEISFIALFVFILGDAAAALVGIEFGKIKIRNKSLEGSAACFLTVFILIYFVFPYFPGIMENFGGCLLLKHALQLSFIVALLEFYTIKIFGTEINDNLYVPVLTGFVLFLI